MTHLGVADDQAILLVPRHQHDLLVDGRVELVQARQHVRQVRHRPAELVDLMKDEVAEELDDVPIPGLGPSRVVVESALASDQREIGPRREREERAYSGRSLMKPNLAISRTSRPFSNSRIRYSSARSFALVHNRQL